MNSQSGLNLNFQNKGLTIDTLDVVIVDALLEGRNVIVPGFGYLELRVFPDNRQTVLFKATPSQDFPQQMYLGGTENEDYFSLLTNCISKPLKEGKAVSMPNLGIFRPLRRGDGNFHVSFTPSSILRKRLNEGQVTNESRRITADLQTKKILSTVSVPELAVIEPVVEKQALVETEIVPELPVKKVEIAPKFPLIESGSNRLSEEGHKNGLFSKLKTIIKPKTNKLENEDIEKERKLNNNRVSSSDETTETDEIIEIKKKNIAGYLLIGVLLITLVIIIITTFTQNKEKDIPPVSDTQPEPRNLVDVAKKNYGNPIFWVYIYESNQDKLTSPVNIPENVVLTIPDLSEYNIDITDTLEIIRARIHAESILRKYIEENK